MSVGRICVRTVLVASPKESVRDAAQRMEKMDVGTLVITDAERRPIGVLTDRDVALRCVAAGRDPDATAVSAIMTTPMRSVVESTPIETALERMASCATRRLAVTDDEGHLVGILSLDDLLELLVEEAESIGRLIARKP